MVHQHFSLIPDFTVIDNLLLGRERGILHRAAYAETLQRVAATFGLPIEPHAKVGDLSVACTLKTLSYTGWSIDADIYPSLANWYARVTERPAWLLAAEQEAAIFASLGG